jgi:hypothetical protein
MPATKEQHMTDKNNDETREGRPERQPRPKRVPKWNPTPEQLDEIARSAGFVGGQAQMEAEFRALPDPKHQGPAAWQVIILETASLQLAARKLVKDARKAARTVQNTEGPFPDGVKDHVQEVFAKARKDLAIVLAALDFTESAVGSTAPGWDEALKELD